jgi:hypothetical protein
MTTRQIAAAAAAARRAEEPVIEIEENLEMQETLDRALKQNAKDWLTVPTGVSTGIDLGAWPAPKWLEDYPHRGLMFQSRLHHHFKRLETLYKPYTRKGKTMYHVQLIAGHRVFKSKPEVLVKWYGYEYPTWEDWNNVKDTINAKDYAKTESLTFEPNCIIVKIDDEVSEELS